MSFCNDETFVNKILSVVQACPHVLDWVNVIVAVTKKFWAKHLHCSVLFSSVGFLQSTFPLHIRRGINLNWIKRCDDNGLFYFIPIVIVTFCDGIILKTEIIHCAQVSNKKPLKKNGMDEWIGLRVGNQRGKQRFNQNFSQTQSSKHNTYVFKCMVYTFFKKRKWKEGMLESRHWMDVVLDWNGNKKIVKERGKFWIYNFNTVLLPIVIIFMLLSRDYHTARKEENEIHILKTWTSLQYSTIRKQPAWLHLNSL